jgi:hypothetical protein
MIISAYRLSNRFRNIESPQFREIIALSPFIKLINRAFYHRCDNFKLKDDSLLLTALFFE